jgi:hypothetical protein
MIARSPKSTWKYVLERDRSLPKEEQTVWKLKHLTLAQEHAIIDQVAYDPITGRGVRQAAGTEHLRSLRHGLVGWENFQREDKTQIEFEAGPLGGAKDELLYLLPLGAREELAQAIENELSIDEAELRKS